MPGPRVHRSRGLPPVPSAMFALFLFAACPPAAGQDGRAPWPTIGQIRVTGNHRLSAEKIIAASGLRPGIPATEHALEEAASRLANTGAFSDVGYQYLPDGKFWDAMIQVVEVQQSLPCIFDNFVWFPDAELKAAVERAVPLFDGSMPVSRGMQDAVTAALDRYLHDHQIQGATTIRPATDLSRHFKVLLLHVNGVSMPVKDVEVAGGPLGAAAVREVAHGILASDYSQHTSEFWAHTALTESYQDEGYLQPRFSTPSVAIVDPAGKDPSQGVIVKFTAAPGLRYTWAGVSWTGNEAVTAEQLSKLMPLATGDIARRSSTLAGWQAVRKEFGRWGYLAADVTTTPVFDDHAGTVHYNALITQGPQFTMGDLVVDDPSPLVVQAVTVAWKLKRGDVYSTDAEQDSIQEILLIQPSLRRADKHLISSRSLNLDKHTVRMLLKFE